MSWNPYRTCMWLPVCLAFATLARTSAADQDAFLTYPDIHGNQAVFTAEGDLWLADIATGDSRRLTSDPGIETQAHFSPDGALIAFTAQYDGPPNVYVMPVSGGVPKRLTFDPREAEVIGWTPDGQSVLYRSGTKLSGPADEGWMTHELLSVPLTGGLPKKVPVPRASFASLNRDGHTLAYVPTSNEWMNWFRYEGGEADKIWLSDLSTGKFTQLTNSKGVDTQPVWVGNTIYFVSERSGIRNLWEMNPGTRKVRPITSSMDGEVSHPSTDGNRVIFECGPKLEVFDPSTMSVRAVPIHLNSDRIHARPFDALIASGPADGSGIGPTGKRVALAVRGHLVTVPVGDGPMHLVAGDSSQRIQDPSWSPDGKRIAYISDASGEEQLYLVDSTEGASPKQLTGVLTGEHRMPLWSPDGKTILLGSRNATVELVDASNGAVKNIARSPGPISYDEVLTDYAFSPDSKWIAFSMPNGLDDDQVWLYRIDSGTVTPVTDPAIESESPAFSPDGKFLYTVQARSLNLAYGNRRLVVQPRYKVTAFALQAGTLSPFLHKDDEEADLPPKTAAPPQETKIDLDGLQDRYFDMNIPSGMYDSLCALEGRLVFSSENAVVSFDIATKTLTTLANGARIIALSADRKKLLVSQGPNIRVLDATGGPAAAGAGEVKLDRLTVRVDPVAEWRQIFEESWRVGRDFFYDPNIHGVNWKAIRTKYEARLPRVATRDDLTRVIKDMISEFNTGHGYVDGPGGLPGWAGKDGVLGADFEWDPRANACRIKHIFRPDSWTPESRSPLADVGLNVHDGDYLLKVRGLPVTGTVDPNSLLLGCGGLTEQVTVNSKPTLEGARTIQVAPISTLDDYTLRVRDWVAGRKAYVNKASAGRIAYVYVGDMGQEGAREFARDYYPNVMKPGIIVDVRGNGGGGISGNLLSDLSGKITGYFAHRSGGTFWRERWAPMGQVVALTDEYAFSDAEEFCEMFKRLKIGPLVGHRTGGGEVGSGNGYPMMDGGDVYIPNYGAWVPGEWVIEGRGAVPDYEVDQDPADVMAGKDPQLDKAIDVILENLKKHPFEVPEHPPFPVKLGGSSGR